MTTMADASGRPFGAILWRIAQVVFTVLLAYVLGGCLFYLFVNFDLLFGS